MFELAGELGYEIAQSNAAYILDELGEELTEMDTLDRHKQVRHQKRDRDGHGETETDRLTGRDRDTHNRERDTHDTDQTDTDTYRQTQIHIDRHRYI